jgi:phage gpG-like protein
MKINIELNVGKLKKKVALTGRKSLALPLQSTARKIEDDIINRVFGQEITPRGEAWADLSPYTWSRKRSSRKLFETGRLLKSIKVTGSRSGLKMSSNTPYSSFHQTGTRKMPARPFFDFPPAYSEIFLKAVRKHLRASGAKR